MASEAEIRRRLQAVADGSVGLWDFADWFDSYSWNMHHDSLPAVIHLAAQIQHRFADYDIHGDESVLRNRLASLLNNVVVADPVDQPGWVAGFSSNPEHRWVLVSHPLAA